MKNKVVNSRHGVADAAERAAAIVVIGSLNMDLTVRVPRLPERGETVAGSDLFTAPGGKGANQAVAAARLGAHVRLVGRVGGDAFGMQLRQGLVAEGIDAATVRTSERPTGVALIVVEEGGQNLITVAPGANADVRPEDVEGVDFKEGLLVTAVLEVPDEAITAAFRRARTTGGRTILNAAPSRPFAAQLWGLTDVLVVNENEAAALVERSVHDPQSALAAARALAARGPQTVAVTLGRQGAVLLDGGGGMARPGSAGLCGGCYCSRRRLGGRPGCLSGSWPAVASASLLHTEVTVP